MIEEYIFRSHVSVGYSMFIPRKYITRERLSTHCWKGLKNSVEQARVSRLDVHHRGNQVSPDILKPCILNLVINREEIKEKKTWIEIYEYNITRLCLS